MRKSFERRSRCLCFGFLQAVLPLPFLPIPQAHLLRSFPLGNAASGGLLTLWRSAFNPWLPLESDLHGCTASSGRPAHFLFSIRSILLFLSACACMPRSLIHTLVHTLKQLSVLYGCLVIPSQTTRGGGSARSVQSLLVQIERHFSHPSTNYQ